MTHDFNAQLAFSHGLSDEPWWEIVYRRAFFDFKAMVDLRDNGWHQQAGRDRAVVLSTGRTLYIDEKGRREEWPDVLVEIWSVYPPGPPVEDYPKVAGAKEGWSRKPLDCDYLAYAFVPSEICHLFPFLGVRQAVVKYGQAWRAEAVENHRRRQSGQRPTGVQWVRAPNKTYNTISLAVPVGRLWSAVTDTLTVSWRVDAPSVPRRPVEDEEDWPTVARPADWEGAA